MGIFCTKTLISFTLVFLDIELIYHHHLMATSPPTFAEIDQAIGDYYSQKGRDDYFNESNKGKFLQLMETNECDEDDIADEIGDDAVSADCGYLDFDEEFPFTADAVNNDQRRSEIFHLLQQIYKNRRAPSLTMEPNQVPNLLMPNSISDATNIPNLVMPNSNSDATIASIETIKRARSLYQTTPHVQIMDEAIGKYYTAQQRSDYLDSNGRGKFMIFCIENAIDDLESEFDDVNDCMVLEFDPDFPIEKGSASGSTEVITEDAFKNAVYSVLHRLYHQNVLSKQPISSLSPLPTNMNNDHITPLGPLAKIDKALGDWYYEMGRDDYYGNESTESPDNLMTPRMGAPRTGLFAKWFENEAFDEHEINEELMDHALDDCVYSGFLEENEDFPFQYAQDTKHRELEFATMLRNCYQFGRAYQRALPRVISLDDINFDVKTDDVQRTMKEYEQQCNGLHDQQDSVMFKYLTIGRRHHNYPLLQSLCDVVCGM